MNEKNICAKVRDDFYAEFKVPLAISDHEILRVFQTEAFRNVHHQNNRFKDLHEAFILRADQAMPTEEDRKWPEKKASEAKTIADIIGPNSTLTTGALAFIIQYVNFCESHAIEFNEENLDDAKKILQFLGLEIGDIAAFDILIDSICGIPETD